MALNQTAIKNSFLAKLNSLEFDNMTTDAQIKEAYAQALSEWVIETITSATVTVPSTGLIAPNGPVNGQATGTIS